LYLAKTAQNQGQKTIADVHDNRHYMYRHQLLFHFAVKHIQFVVLILDQTHGVYMVVYNKMVVMQRNVCVGVFVPQSMLLDRQESQERLLMLLHQKVVVLE
jgi:hypothetical protein